MLKNKSITFILLLLIGMGYSDPRIQRDNDKECHTIYPKDIEGMTEAERQQFEDMQREMKAMMLEWEEGQTPEQRQQIRQYKEEMDRMLEQHTDHQHSNYKIRQRLQSALNNNQLTEEQRIQIQQAHVKMRERRAKRIEKIKAIRERKSTQQIPSQ